MYIYCISNCISKIVYLTLCYRSIETDDEVFDSIIFDDSDYSNESPSSDEYCISSPELSDVVQARVRSFPVFLSARYGLNIFRTARIVKFFCRHEQTLVQALLISSVDTRKMIYSFMKEPNINKYFFKKLSF